MDSEVDFKSSCPIINFIKDTKQAKWAI